MLLFFFSTFFLKNYPSHLCHILEEMCKTEERVIQGLCAIMFSKRKQRKSPLSKVLNLLVPFLFTTWSLCVFFHISKKKFFFWSCLFPSPPFFWNLVWASDSRSVISVTGVWRMLHGLMSLFSCLEWPFSCHSRAGPVYQFHGGPII